MDRAKLDIILEAAEVSRVKTNGQSHEMSELRALIEPDMRPVSLVRVWSIRTTRRSRRHPGHLPLHTPACTLPATRIARRGQLVFRLPSLPRLYVHVHSLSRNGKINFTFHRATSRVVMPPASPVPERNCTSNMLTSNTKQFLCISGLIKGTSFSRSS